MKVLCPSTPNMLLFNHEAQTITFSKPDQHGGSYIQGYEVHIRPHGDENAWFLQCIVKVKNLSQDPNIPANVFGRLAGHYDIRVCARNLAGLGIAAETSVVLTGDLPFFPETNQEVTADRFDVQHATFFVEYFFFSDHKDAPKVRDSIKKLNQLVLGHCLNLQCPPTCIWRC